MSEEVAWCHMLAFSAPSALPPSTFQQVDALSCVTSDEGWQVVRDDALKLMYRHEAGSVVHRFKGKCILDAPIEVRCISLVIASRLLDVSVPWEEHGQHAPHRHGIMRSPNNPILCAALALRSNH